MVRVSNVKPCLKVACYVCDVCGHELYQLINDRKNYEPLTDGACPSQVCKTNNSRGKVFPNLKASKFVARQEIRLTETADQVPVGSIPRTFTAIATGEGLVRQCNPGDIVSMTGVYLPIQVDSFRGPQGGMIHNTEIHIFKIEKEKKRYAQLLIDGNDNKTIQK